MRLGRRPSWTSEAAALGVAEQTRAEQERSLAEAEADAERRWRSAEADYVERVELLAQAEVGVRERERQLAARLESAATADRDLDGARAELERRGKELDVRLNALGNIEIELAERERAQARADTVLVDRRLELEQRAAALAVAERDLADDREAARLRLVELEGTRSEAATRARAVPEATRSPITNHLLFIATSRGYAVLEREGVLPADGAALEVALPGNNDGCFIVCKLGRVADPFDDRPCAYLEPLVTKG